jgi:FKBP-type peptidyl-prolyl cis-trans isomerase FklB
MKKIIMLALIIAASSAVYAVPGKKKKKEAEKTEQPKPVVLTSASDTLSYAAGKMLTRGLDQYLISELKVDTAYMAEVEAGSEASFYLAYGEREAGEIKPFSTLIFKIELLKVK